MLLLNKMNYKRLFINYKATNNPNKLAYF